jgi:hypothetical protein
MEKNDADKRERERERGIRREDRIEMSASHV